MFSSNNEDFNVREEVMKIWEIGRSFGLEVYKDYEVVRFLKLINRSRAEKRGISKKGRSIIR